MKKNILFLMALVLGLNFTKAQMMEDSSAGISSETQFETQEEPLFAPNTPTNLSFGPDNTSINHDAVKPENTSIRHDAVKIVLRDQTTNTDDTDPKLEAVKIVFREHATTDTNDLDNYIKENNEFNFINFKKQIVHEKSFNGKKYIYSLDPRLDTVMPYIKYIKTKKYSKRFGKIYIYECLKPSKFKRIIKLVTIGVPIVVAAACGADAIMKNGYLPAVSEFVKKYYTPGQICAATGKLLKPSTDLIKEYGGIAITAARAKMANFFEYLYRTTKPKTGWFPSIKITRQ
ncbi:hypothetical protein K9L05_02195 [Candidatus Babeliales bacterium]|nr:hypothetical protein [Candidatus Babeliales bacterium]MCF7899440.1 hypothetical protein [Candidatus Babeliales bacterium]